MNFPQNSESCSNCKQFFLGYGFNFSYRLAKYAYFDSGAKLFPGSGSYGQNGTAQEGLVGLKLGPTLDRWGFFFNLRNGFIHYDKTLVPGRSSSYESTWRYALDLIAPSNSTLRAIPLSVSMAAPPSFTTSRAIPIPISRPPAFSPHSIIPSSAVPISPAVTLSASDQFEEDLPVIAAKRLAGVIRRDVNQNQRRNGAHHTKNNGAEG